MMSATTTNAHPSLSYSSATKQIGKIEKPKRKKTSRACIHCQKAHVTCDEGRPCQRCIKKGCEASCHDGVRKKAKYLQDSILEGGGRPPKRKLSNDRGPQWNTILNPSAAMQVPQIPSSKLQSLPPTPPDPQLRYKPQPIASAIRDDPLADLNMTYNDFGSRTANLEYSILSNILQATGTDLSAAGLDDSGNPLINTLTTPESSDSPLTASLPPWQHSHPQTQTQAQTQQLVQMLGSSPIASEYEQKRPEDVYSSVTQPFPYTQGYHGLIAYLRSRFGRKHLMHMAQAMAAYRPSFIATTKTLKEEDLIFMEKCFQRTLLEFEKFIASSGTPTVVWRRTGQIAAVGKEFCILTEWSRERLLTQQTFIVELMDDKSVIDYFDVFSRLAFGDSRGVTMTECTLLKPDGTRVPTACTWTVKRDVFDIPMMIIGNFLPILS
ncbi:transcription activator of gluconeogenesis [Trichomonascus vanleenenianus]|uniref:transcription activator of gluconeogenesis n=1 Tax=Trichomonascus vanleenenianus TaxID=2268995 RepID=UPI003ECA2F52